jgi:hypothetical protein
VAKYSARNRISITQIALMEFLRFVFCVVCIAYFYNLIGTSPRFPFSDYASEFFAVCRTAFVAIAISSWLLWLSRHWTRSFRTLLGLALLTQICLTAYGIIGCCHNSSTWLNPSTFFAEYNWLTFILEIGPLVSISTSALTFIFLWEWKFERSSSRETESL